MKMVTTFNTKDMLNFGNYMLSDRRALAVEKTRLRAIAKGLDVEFISNEATHSDLENWKAEQQ